MAKGAPILTYTQLGVIILDLFLGLTAMHPTRTPGGALDDRRLHGQQQLDDVGDALAVR